MSAPAGVSRRRPSLAAGCLALALAASTSPRAVAQSPTDAWRTFSGTWSASGQRRLLALQGGVVAAVAEVSGAIVLTAGEDVSRGFLGQAIVFDDGEALSVGRAAWTDENGDQLFSELKGETVRTGKKVVATITGGTGRYAGLQGEYSFTWQYVVTGADGLVQGRAVGLSGRVRRGEPLR